MGRWFGPKRFGFGFRPVAWQGWVITLVAVAILIVVVRTIKGW